MIKRKASMKLISSNLNGFLKKNSPKFVSAGHEVIDASNGEEGIRLMHESSAEMVITDLIMPKKLEWKL